MNSQLAIIVLLVILVVLVAVNIWLYRHYRRNIKKVTFLFDAIDNGDFSFSFPTEKRFKEDKILHQSLNRIKLFLQHTREEQMDREKYYEQILNAVDTGILVVDGHDNILQHNQAALRLLNTDVLTHMNQVKGKLKDEHLAKHETQAMLKDKHVRIIALSDVSHELSNQEVDSWIKLIRVLTHEIMNTITPVTSLSETLLKELGSKELLIADNESDDLHSPGKLIKVSEKPQSAEQAKLKQGLKTIHKTGTELLAFVNNYRRFTHVPQPQPALFYVEPFLERMALLCNHEVEIEVSPKDLLAYADESLYPSQSLRQRPGIHHHRREQQRRSHPRRCSLPHFHPVLHHEAGRKRNRSLPLPPDHASKRRQPLALSGQGTGNHHLPHHHPIKKYNFGEESLALSLFYHIFAIIKD